jgi:hypothetical protein
MSNATRIRLYELARDLDVDSKQIMVVCGQIGIDAKNMLSSLTLAQCKAIERVIRRDGPDEGAKAPAKLRPMPPTNSSRVSLQEPT